MDEAPQQILRDIERAKRIVDGLSDRESRRSLGAYIAELEARLALADAEPVAVPA